MPFRRPKTWFLIADGARARLLRNDGPGTALVAAVEEEFIAPAVHGFSRDLKSDRPGRAFDPAGGRPHAMEPRNDPHELEKKQFARHVAQVVDGHAAGRAFDRLVIVAPPKTLGDLRAELSAHTAALVVAEVAKDLTHVPADKLRDHLGDLPQV